MIFKLIYKPTGELVLDAAERQRRERDLRGRREFLRVSSPAWPAELRRLSRRIHPGGETTQSEISAAAGKIE